MGRKAFAVWSDDKLRCRVLLESGIEIGKFSREQKDYVLTTKKGADEPCLCW
jgi:hypothetical protein